MAYSQVYTNNNATKIKAVFDTLVDNGIVGAVEADTSGTYPVYKIYEDAEKQHEFFRITQSLGNSDVTGMKFEYRFTVSDGTYKTDTPGLNNTIPSTSTGHRLRMQNIMRCYTCSNGIWVLIFGGDYYNSTQGQTWWLSQSFIITSNDSGSPTIIYCGNTDVSNCDSTIMRDNANTQWVLAYSDTAPLNQVVNYSPYQREQIVFTPFFTCNAPQTTSFTPNAGRITAGNIGDLVTNGWLVEVEFGGALWLTNGYWMLKE